MKQVVRYIQRAAVCYVKDDDNCQVENLRWIKKVYYRRINNNKLHSIIYFITGFEQQSKYFPPEADIFEITAIFGSVPLEEFQCGLYNQKSWIVKVVLYTI